MKRAAAILGVLVAAGLGHAGRKSSYPVYVSTFSAWGSLGTARNSADSTQYIGCGTTYYTTSTPYASCTAVDERGASRNCYTYDARFIEIARSMTPDAHIQFGWSGSVCDLISIRTTSYDEPRVP